MYFKPGTMEEIRRTLDKGGTDVQSEGRKHRIELKLKIATLPFGGLIESELFDCKWRWWLDGEVVDCRRRVCGNKGRFKCSPWRFLA